LAVCTAGQLQAVSFVLIVVDDYIYGKSEIRFIRGRIKFEDEDGNTKSSAPFPSMAVVYNGRKDEKK